MLKNPCWSWQRSCFRRTFRVAGAVREALVTVTGSAACEVFLNGRSLGAVDKLSDLGFLDAATHLHAGVNCLAIEAWGGPQFRFRGREEACPAVILELRQRSDLERRSAGRTRREPG